VSRIHLQISELVALSGGRLRKQPLSENVVVKGFASLGDASSDDLSFLGNEKYLSDYLNTAAGVVFVPAQAPPGPETLVEIEVSNPSLAFSLAMESVSKSRSFKEGIHPTAVIDSSARVDGVEIGPHVVIEANVVVGAGTRLGPGVTLSEGAQVGKDCHFYGNVTVREFCQIGNHVILQPGVVIGSEGYGYELVDGCYRSIPQVGIVVLEDHVEVGANTTIDRARFGETRVGEGTKIDNLVQIGHNVTIGQHCLIVAQVGIAGSTQLGNYVTVAAQTGIAGHLKLEDKVVLAAKSGVSRSLKAGTYWGTPAIPIQEEKKLKVVGRKLPELKATLRKLEKEVSSLKKQLSNTED